MDNYEIEFAFSGAVRIPAENFTDASNKWNEMDYQEILELYRKQTGNRNFFEELSISLYFDKERYEHDFS